MLRASQLPLPVTLCHQPAGTLHSTAEVQKGHRAHTCRLSAEHAFLASRHTRDAPRLCLSLQSDLVSPVSPSLGVPNA